MGEGRSSGDEPPTNQRLTVPEAASWLGITEAAVRGRIKRGTLRFYREEGNVYVVLVGDESRGESTANRDATDAAPATDPREELVEELRDRIAYLERQVEEEREARRRADTLMARFLERVPELEAPRDTAREEDTGHDAGETRLTRVQDAGEDATSPQAPFPRPERSWWRRFFGIE